MTSQVVVNIDTELKKKAMAMAKKEGLTMKALLSFLLKGYIEEDITLGARLERYYDTDLETIEWSPGELELLKEDRELLKLGNKFNELIIEKGI